MRLREPHEILHNNKTCEILSELADTTVRVSHLNVVTITKSETAYIKAPEEFLKQVRLLQTINSYML